MFCLRADVRADGFASSLLSTKLTLGITVIFADSSSEFQLEMQTAEFSDAHIEYTSERALGFAVSLGRCLAPQNDGPYGFGSTLKFCVKSADSDIIISALNDVLFTDLDGNFILDIIDNVGEPSYVTTVGGLGSKSVDVATMLVSDIFDRGFGGTSINVRGTASITYVDEEPTPFTRRLKHTAESPFVFQVVVGDITNPQPVADDSNSASVLPQVSGGVIAGLVIVGIVIASILV
jgi:hypothetical protein